MVRRQIDLIKDPPVTQPDMRCDRRVAPSRSTTTKMTTLASKPLSLSRSGIILDISRVPNLFRGVRKRPATSEFRISAYGDAAPRRRCAILKIGIKFLRSKLLSQFRWSGGGSGPAVALWGAGRDHGRTPLRFSARESLMVLQAHPEIRAQALALS